MPISSGANSWPNSYFRPPPPKSPPPKVSVIRQSPPPSAKFYRPRPPTTIIQDPQVIYLQGPPAVPPRSPSPQRIYTGQPQPTIIYANPPPQPNPQQTIIYSNPPAYGKAPPPPPQQTIIYGNHPVQPYSGYPDPGVYDDDGCCGHDYFTTGVTGANAGCCQGGMFGSRKYPYMPEHNYAMKGTGRRRCCACVWGTIIGLLLLGLLIGLLAGLMPSVISKNNQSSVASKYPNGYWLNGIYYYQITNPADVFYFAMGPGIPCNPNNNNVMPVNTVGYNTIVSTDLTVPFTDALQTTVPNCNSVTSSYILAKGYSITTTTVNPFSLIPSSAHLSTAGPLLIFTTVCVWFNLHYM